MDATMVVVFLGVLGGLMPDLLRIAKVRGDITKVGGTNVLISMVVLGLIGAAASLAADAADPGAPTVLSSLFAGFTGPEVISRLLGSDSGGAVTTATTRRLRGWWTV